ncbi:metal-dependent hydrolase [Ktedonosporobacter rubrisoli]|uniref:UPF0173 metal-dependent hydrolase EPA93_00365 n=1 Tax=Ktedonosporobacter rubrisoli TaxID=2509675 RepID=A0A4P6JHN8_KTERU|nr:metal-dependent hydrolase [Ktedonosporobacter rubrisoli]QBD74527.1 metal-dependent hydrolase [Ktedonosporobacter rubrisoli]
MVADLKGNRISWLGHAAFKITTPSNKVILIDPFLTHNPATPAEAKKQDQVDLILVTHGHGDHTEDVVSLAKAHNAEVVTIVELAAWFGSKGVENAVGMNKGGSYTSQGITVHMTHALHTGGVGEGNDFPYTGDAAGFVIDLEHGLSVYHAGDTAPFMDMQLIKELYAPELAMLPIGDFYTMGPKGAAISARMLGVKYVIPMHFGTFPILVGTPAQLREAMHKINLDNVEVIEMKPGETIG